jgi:hypothetical protein
MRARAAAALLAAALALVCGPGAAQQGSVERQARRQANAALSLLSVSASPNRSASALYIDNRGGSPFELAAVQAGGGFQLKGARPIWLEGFVAASLYDPEIIVGPGVSADARWRNLSATGGIGWNFAITEHLTARPILNAALGSVTANADGLLPLPRDLPFAGSADFFAWGLGGSAVLDYARAFGTVEVDTELRLTVMRLESFERIFGVSAWSDAASLAMWNRVRVPTGWTLLDRPLRAVGELSASWLPGDQRAALRTRWLVQAGGGLELDFTALGDPWIRRTRLMLRAVTGQELNGVSVGLGFTF